MFNWVVKQLTDPESKRASCVLEVEKLLIIIISYWDITFLFYKKSLIFFDPMTMEIFELVKNHLTILGFSPIQSIQSYPFLNSKLLGAFVAIITNMVLSCIYFFFVASSFEEYIDSFFTSSGSTGIFVIFSIYVWKMKELFQYINILHETVNASKLMRS